MIEATTFSLCALLALSCGLFVGWALRASYADHRVDPWQLQHRLMSISNQPTPTFIQINRGTLTYLALVMEELAETIEPVNDVLQRASSSPLEPMVITAPTTRAVGQMLRNVRQDLATISAQLRTRAARLPDHWHLPMLEGEAVRMADGCTDLSVVSCGLTIAAGVPGPDCYEEVMRSNLSKTNPLTGLIDKDASGKWIKGPNYRPPSLVNVLDVKGAVQSSWPRR